MEAKVTWQGNLTFEGTADSGYKVPLGTEPEVGGNNDGFKPMELLLTGLAGCTAMDVISILKKKKQDVTDFEVKAHADRASEQPRVFTHIMIEYIVTGHHVDPVAVDRAIELSESKYCPAQAMLKKAVTIEHKATILEATE
ncbi:MAG TPA: OsmC family protein [Anaerolineaceae bacterium]|nr:OsmC family protein [Anaerolineaceae bacterium]